MTLEILIATMEDRLPRVADVLLPQRDGIGYLVSCQYAEAVPPIPLALARRTDVRVVFLQGRGLSNNRNNALRHALNDVLLIADDDCRYSEEGLQQLIGLYESRPHLDIALLKVEGMSKYYPSRSFHFTQRDFRSAYSVASVEMSMRRVAVQQLSFDARFGLGSDFLAAGEEQVFICDALTEGKCVEWHPLLVGSTSPGTTGERFLDDVAVQRSKGATFCYLFGRRRALWMCFKEAMHYFVFKRVNPFELMRQMNSGIRYIHTRQA